MVSAVEPFWVRVMVRGYEVDPRGHVNQAVYLQYAEHARWECMRAAGIAHDLLLEVGVGPVALENQIRYLAELRAEETVDVSVRFEWTDRKIFRIVQQFRKADGTRAAELTAVVGMMDTTERKLILDPAGFFRKHATDPAVLGL